MSSELKFSSNLNNKLSCNYFLSFRVANPAYRLENVLDVSCPDVKPFKVKIKNLKFLKYSEISDFVSYMDSGMPKDAFKESLKDIFGNSVETMSFSLLLLQRLK